MLAGVTPAAIAWVGALIVDAVVAAVGAGGGDATRVVRLVLLEGGLVAVLAAIV